MPAKSTAAPTATATRKKPASSKPTTKAAKPVNSLSNSKDGPTQQISALQTKQPLTAATTQQLIKKFSMLAEWARVIQKECLNARKVLERINAPAPNGGKKKKGMGDAELARFELKCKKSLSRHPRPSQFA